MRPIQSVLAIGCALALLAAGASLAQSTSTTPARPPANRPAAPPAAAPAAAPAQAAPGASAQAAPAAPTQSQPVRTETITFTNWTVTCREVGGATKRNCSAVMQAIDQNRRQVVMTWIFGHTPEGALTTVLRTPTGVLLQRGVDLKLGEAAPRKLTYVNCDTQQCEATIPMDNAFVKDASAAQSAAAVIVAKTGQTITVTLPIAGFDKAVAAVTKG
jgi:invasion protein IalB